MNSYRPILTTLVIAVLFAAVVMGQEASEPSRFELNSFVICTPEKIAEIRAAGGWTTYDIMHEDQDKVKAQLEATKGKRKNPVEIYQCGNSPGSQQHVARKFSGLVDLYSYRAFRGTSTNRPSEDDVFWPGYDNPFINHAREIRKLAGSTPVIAYLTWTMKQDGQKRPTQLEEIQWQLIASLGVDYRGIHWDGVPEEMAGKNVLKEMVSGIEKYAPKLGEACPVDWVATTDGTPVSAKACKNYLFIFLLNPTYMTLKGDGKTVKVPLEGQTCTGVIEITLPDGVKARKVQALNGKTLRLKSNGKGAIVPFHFRGGGDMLILNISGVFAPAKIRTQHENNDAMERQNDSDKSKS